MGRIEPLFVEGGVYESKTHGPVTYRGIDVYYGEATFMFDSHLYGRQYWLREGLKHHFKEFEDENNETDR